MTVTKQKCSISKQHDGRVIYLPQRISATFSELFPLSKDANFDYKAEFDDETQVLRIYKDI